MVTRLSVLLPCHKCKVVYSEVKDEEVPSLLLWEYTPVVTPEQLIRGSCFSVYIASYDICEIIWGSLSLIGDSRSVTPYSMRKCSIRFGEIGPLLWQFFLFTRVGRSLKSWDCLIPSLLLGVWIAGVSRSHEKFWMKNLRAEIFVSLELKVISMEAQFLSRTSLIMTHMALENNKESNIKKILAILVFNDRSQLQERK